MTREEAKQVFLSRGYVEVEGGTIYDPDKWRESCRVISEWLEQEPVLDKIRAEIADMPKIYPFIDHIDTYVKDDDVLAIIDKYRNEVSK